MVRETVAQRLDLTPNLTQTTIIVGTAAEGAPSP
eukprot:gene25741-11429_t